MEPVPDPPPEVEELLAHAEFVRAVARRLCSSDAHGAEDLAQDVWVAALESPRRAVPPANWLARVARNLRTSRLRRTSAELGDPDPAERAAHGVDHAAVDEARLAVARAVRRLRDPYREVLVLRYYESLEPREIARRCERPVATVHTQVKRALALLRAELARERGRDGGARALVLAALPAGSDASAPLRRVWAGASLSAALLLVGGGAWLAAMRSGGAPVSSAPAAPSEEIAAAPQPSLREPDLDVARGAATEPAPEPVASPSDAASEDEVASARYPVEVRVTDESGAPVAGAEVLLETAVDWDLRGRSDADGRAAFEVDERDLGLGVLPPGSGMFRVRAEGRATIQEVLFDARIAREEPIAMLVGRAAAGLHGRVADADGFAVDGADVIVLPMRVPTGDTRDGVLRRTARHHARTDSEGRFELDRMPGGEMQINLRHPELGIDGARTELASGSTVEREVRFDAGAVVHGMVRVADGAPLDRARVRAYWSGPVNLPDAWTMAACDPDGRYALALPAGNGIELWAASGEFDVVQAALGPLDLAAGERRDWSPELRRWDPVRVRLVDGDGAALAGWVVSLHSGPLAQLKRSELTDSEGRASVRLPIEGPQRIEVLGPLDAISLRHVLEGVLPDADVEHLLVIDARQRDLGGLTGRLELAGWRPPEGFLIALQREADGYMVRVPVDAQLRFRCANLVPGNYCLTLLAENELAGECGRATVEPGRTLDLGVLALPTAAQLDLSDLAPNAFVELACEHGVQACWSRETELVEPLPLLPGAYELRVQPPDRDTPPSTLRFNVAPAQHIAIGADLSLH